MSNEFYIGYEDNPPPQLSRFLGRVVLGLVVLLVVIAGAVAATQSPAEPGNYEFGVEKSFEGLLVEGSLPLLQVGTSPGAITNYLLVGAGKFGLPAFARGHGGERVQFRGSLIQKGTAVMIEMNDPSSFRPSSLSATRTPEEKGGPGQRRGAVSLVGELVDTKCYLGVMRPGSGKVHRGCAVRCLHGGVPPGLLLRDSAGNALVVMLTGTGTSKLDVDPEWAARWIRVEGQLLMRGNVPVLEVSRFELAD